MYTVSWFSAGVSSAVATKLAIAGIDEIIYTHIDDQHKDTIRFLDDCEGWFGKPITMLMSPYRCVANAVRAGGSRFINGPSGAICTRYLKKRVRVEWELEHEHLKPFRYVWGLDLKETKPRPPRGISRVQGIREAMPEHEHWFPLVDAELEKKDIHQILKASGIKRPAMYDLGYHNNNCVGCVKGGKGYWNKIRVDFPDVFASRAKLERACDASCINGTFLDELDPDAGRKQGPIVDECGIMCELISL